MNRCVVFLLNHSFPTNPNKMTNCFKLFSLLQLTTTLLLRRFLILNRPSLYEEGSVLNVLLRSIVAFLEETLIESVVFFFLQYGSGMDQGYRAVGGGLVCGLLYATLTALQHIPLFPGKYFSEESVHRVYGSTVVIVIVIFIS